MAQWLFLVVATATFAAVTAKMQFNLATICPLAGTLTCFEGVYPLCKPNAIPIDLASAYNYTNATQLRSVLPKDAIAAAAAAVRMTYRQSLLGNGFTAEEISSMYCACPAGSMGMFCNIKNVDNCGDKSLAGYGTSDGGAYKYASPVCPINTACQPTEGVFPWMKCVARHNDGTPPAASTTNIATTMNDVTMVAAKDTPIATTPSRISFLQSQPLWVWEKILQFISSLDLTTAANTVISTTTSATTTTPATTTTSATTTASADDYYYQD